MKDIDAIMYRDISLEKLRQALNEQGMVFVRLTSGKAKAFIRFYNHALKIEKPRPSNLYPATKYWNLFVGILLLLWTTVFHSRLMEMDTFRILEDVRCTWDVEENGDYRFTFS